MKSSHLEYVNQCAQNYFLKLTQHRIKLTVTKQLHVIRINVIYGRILNSLNITAVQVGLSSDLFYSFKIFSSFLKHIFVILFTTSKPPTSIQKGHRSQQILKI